MEMEKRTIELIDRHEIIHKIEPWLYSDGRGDSELNMLRAVIAVLKEAPAIDAVPATKTGIAMKENAEAGKYSEVIRIN